MAPFTGCCLAAPAGRGAVRPAPAASRSPPCSLAPPLAWLLLLLSAAPRRPRPRCRVACGRRGAPMGTRVSRRLCPGCVRARAHACVPCAHGHVCRRARAPVLPIHPRGLPARRTLPAARTSVSGPRVPAPPVGTVPSLPSVAPPTPSFCTDPFPHRRLPSVPLHPVWVTPPSSPVWALSLSSDLTAHSRPPPPSTWSRGQPAPPRLMALGLFQ